MKQIIIYSLLSVVLFASCRKSDNSKLPDLSRVPVPLITKDATGNATIDGNAPNTFSGKVKVDLYFKDDTKPAKFDIVVIKNGDKSIVKTLQAGVTSFPTTVTVTGLQLATLFGTPIVLGDKFDIGADVTTLSGQKFEAFPLSGVGYGTGVANQPGASTSISYSAVCPFDINSFLGAATIQDPDFWGADYPVTVSLESADTYKILGWVEEPSYYILVKVNTAALTVAVTKRVYGPTLPTTSYTNPASEGTGTIDACSKKIIMNLTNTVAQGSFGAAVITLSK
ncbi:MAG: hypothetical protein ABIQ88_13610 [Chitinophagaceae bacterium]